MAPGPLLTVAITESAKRGGIAGPLLILGHGILEFILLLLIVFGLGNILRNEVLFSVIALVGGIILVLMGIHTIRGLKEYTLVVSGKDVRQGVHPVVSGIVVSLSNPYWFIWWLTIGMGYVIFAKASGIYGIIAFFAGHILSDLAWYSFVSYGVYFGGKYLNIKALKAILLLCSIFLIALGVLYIIKGFVISL